ncbi:MAG: ABC transporter ATP-binding protein [Sulfurospirillaceae bacterium]|nr:ABC transporter ATP-binding protein [Sulfurospirillaceae bacterium]
MIKLEKVTKVFAQGQNEVVALKDISLHVRGGEFVVLKGASGSGKSTILSLIAGLSKPTCGEILVDGKSISKLFDNFSAMFRRENIGFIFQKYNLIPTLSVKENIIVPLIPSNPDPKEIQIRACEVMEKFSIASKADMLVKNLSGGEQQRVAIARALINNPRIIIADEPTANLDSKLSLELIEILKKLKAENRTILVATHDPLFFELDCVDCVIEVKNGEILK